MHFSVFFHELPGAATITVARVKNVRELSQLMAALYRNPTFFFWYTDDEWRKRDALIFPGPIPAQEEPKCRAYWLFFICGEPVCPF